MLATSIRAAKYPKRSPESRSPHEIERQLAWRAGELALDGETLAFAVGEISRYNVRNLVPADSELGTTPLVGYFRTTEPENLGRMVSSMTGAWVVVEGDVVRLERERGQ